MGTRADFYVGRSASARWLGSVAYDGYPDGIPRKVLRAVTAKDFRVYVREFLRDSESGTLPAQGWPWPWDDSATSDYAYAFDRGRVWATTGDVWFLATDSKAETVEFPDMAERRKIAAPGSLRSGIMVFGR